MPITRVDNNIYHNRTHSPVWYDQNRAGDVIIEWIMYSLINHDWDYVWNTARDYTLNFMYDKYEFITLAFLMFLVFNRKLKNEMKTLQDKYETLNTEVETLKKKLLRRKLKKRILKKLNKRKFVHEEDVPQKKFKHDYVERISIGDISSEFKGTHTVFDQYSGYGIIFITSNPVVNGKACSRDNVLDKTNMTLRWSGQPTHVMDHIVTEGNRMIHVCIRNGRRSAYTYYGVIDRSTIVLLSAGNAEESIPDIWKFSIKTRGIELPVFSGTVMKRIDGKPPQESAVEGLGYVYNGGCSGIYEIWP